MKTRLLSILFFIFSFFAAAQDVRVGDKVTIVAVDKKTYNGTITAVVNGQYKVHYDGYDFDALLTREQFQLVERAVQKGIPEPKGTKIASTNNSANDVKSIFDFGKKQGWASVVQENKFSQYMASLSATDKQNLLIFINQAKTNSARFFVLKSLLAGDNFTILQKFIDQTNPFPETYQQERCLATTRQSIIQQWELSCSVTAVQTYLADLCPRYAWEVKQINNYNIVANDPNNPMAQQQKMLLEHYGGIATARGDHTGKAIGINDALNEYVGLILGVRFYANPVTEELPELLSKIRAQIDKGLNVPLLINFVGTDANHFLLAMKYRSTARGFQYLIYDPWDGVCDYVTEASLQQNSLSPLLTKWKVKIIYYYPTVPLTQFEMDELYKKRQTTN